MPSIISTTRFRSSNRRSHSTRKLIATGLYALPTHAAFLDPVAFQNTLYGSPIVPRGQSGHDALLHCLLQFPVFPFLSKKSGGLFSPIYLAPFKTVLLVSGRDANDQILFQSDAR